MNTQKLLVAILVLQSLVLLNQWVGSPISAAQAQVPDAGAQQLQVIDELKTSNDLLKGIDEKMDKLSSLLESGKLQVATSKPDDNEQK